MDATNPTPYGHARMIRSALILGASCLALTPADAPAQTTVPVDQLPGIPLPTATPTPTPAPSPAATPTPAPTATATPTDTPVPAREPTPTAHRRPAATRVARPTPRATPTPEPSATPSPSPTPTPTPTPVPPIETVVLPSTSRPAPLWPWLAGGAALLLGATLLLLRRRDRPVEPIAPPPPTPAPPPALPVVRPRLAIGVRPTRAGLNLLTATVDGEVTITNTGDAPAHDIRVAVGLLSAHADAGELVANFAAQPIGRPATPPFALAPGEDRRFRAVVALPHDAIQPMTAAGRPMFVPLVAVSARYRDAPVGQGAERRTAQAFAVGLQRPDSAKLAPLWLDVPPRAYENVAARPHEGALEG